jgi:glycosyltransferase involved in cell wall biosynthesis
MQEFNFSVVIPAYNHGAEVAKSVNSGLRQVGVREVVVVDDGSTESVAATLSGITDPRLKLITFPARRGANAARNAGIAATTSDYIAFLDADDVYLPNRLAEAERTFALYPDLLATHCSFVAERRSIQANAANPDLLLSGNELEVAMVGHVFPLTNSAIVAKRSALASIGNFDESLQRQQDRDLLLRLAPVGPVAFTSFVGLIKHQSDNSMSRNLRHYISGLDRLVGKHAIFLAPEHRVMLSYLTSRMMIKAIAAGDFASLLAEWRELQRSLHLPKSAIDLVLNYHRGRRERRDLTNTVFAWPKG